MRVRGGLLLLLSVAGCGTGADTTLPPVISLAPASLPRGTVGTPYSVQLSASGGTAPYTFTVGSGSLPAGLTLTTAGVLSGTPSAAGSSDFVVRATDSDGHAGTAPYTLVIGERAANVTIAPSTLPAGVVGVAYSAQLTASGGTAPYTFAVASGALPGGLTLSTAGLVSGVPSGAGMFTFTVRATDAGGAAGSATYTMGVASGAAIEITGFAPGSGPIGTFVAVDGRGFAGATRVAFNRVRASYNVVSDARIDAIVPAGATTGPIVVTAPVGTATSALDFTVDTATCTVTVPACPGPNLIRNASFETASPLATGQGLLPNEWVIVQQSPDTFSNDGSFGLPPEGFGNFTGVTAFDGIRWVAGWASVPEVFGQVLTSTLAPGARYRVSAYFRRAIRADLAVPGGYDVALGTEDNQTREVLGRFCPDAEQWEERSFYFLAPRSQVPLRLLSFTPYAGYSGTDAVSLTRCP